jgi:hypothetical protein
VFKIENQDGSEFGVKIAFVPVANSAYCAPSLRIEVTSPTGDLVFDLNLEADGIDTDDDRQTVQTFAYAVDEEVRKVEYRRRFPVEEGEHNVHAIELEMQEDWSEWAFRQRRGRARYEGLGDDALRAWHMHR